MTMTFVEYRGDGVTNSFSVPFPYISKEHVIGRLDGQQTPITFDSDALIRFAQPPATGVLIELRRVTPRHTRLVDYQNGATLTEEDLDLASLQTFYIVQETSEATSGQLALNAAGAYDARQRRISHVGPPTEADDALTRDYFDSQYLPAMRQVLAATQAAAAGNTAAVQSATQQAGQHATTAADAATNATTALTNATHAAQSAATAAATGANHASNAANSAQTAANSAERAHTQATAAASSASSAATYAASAIRSSTAASHSAETAAHDATSATSAAQSASGDAASATNHASSSASHATQASTAAQAADQSAKEAKAAAAQAVAAASGGSIDPAALQGYVDDARAAASQAATSAQSATTKAEAASSAASSAETAAQSTAAASQSAAAKAAAAGNSATSAQQAAQSATTASTTATTKADHAATSASAAATSATAASNSAASAAAKATAATQAATAANTSAGAAAASATSAENAASAAQAAKDAAATSATSAGNAATQATGARDQASASASNAAAKATAANQSALDAAASAASVQDVSTSIGPYPLPATISNRQYLRLNAAGTGYEGRWPAQMLADIGAVAAAGGTFSGLVTHAAGVASQGPLTITNANIEHRASDAYKYRMVDVTAEATNYTVFLPGVMALGRHEGGILKLHQAGAEKCRMKWDSAQSECVLATTSDNAALHLRDDRTVTLTYGEKHAWQGGSVCTWETDGRIRITHHGTIIFHSTDNASDPALKSHVRTLTQALAAVRRLRGIRFQWNEKMGAAYAGKEAIGVLATEVETVFPELVTHHNGKRGHVGTMTVDYSKLTAVLIEAVKELAAKVQILEHHMEAPHARA